MGKPPPNRAASTEIARTKEAQSARIANEGSNGLYCAACDKRFARRDRESYEMHLKKKHGINPTTSIGPSSAEPSRIKEAPLTRIANEGPNGLYCDSCNKHFARGDRDSYERHLQTHMNLLTVCDVCQLDCQSQTRLKDHMFGAWHNLVQTLVEPMSPGIVAPSCPPLPCISAMISVGAP